MAVISTASQGNPRKRDVSAELRKLADTAAPRLVVAELASVLDALVDMTLIVV